MEPDAPGKVVEPGEAERSAKLWRWALPTAAAVVVIGVAAGVLVWLEPWVGNVAPASLARMVFSLPDRPSIAVLPFTNLSDDPEQEWFADGMTDDLITDLSRISGLFVIARNTSFTYKGKNVKVHEVAEELGVRYVLEGSVRRAGDQVRINAQLIDVSTGGHVWAERYDRTLEDIFALQDEVTRKIVSALAVEVSAAEAKQASRRDTDNLAAYDYVLQGREYLRQFTKESHAAGRALFEKAIELDPNYVRAYSHLAWTHLNDWQMGWSVSPQQSLEHAFGLAQKAVSLDDSEPQAHEVLAEVYLWKKNHESALAESEIALTLDPNSADRHVVLRTPWSGWGGRTRRSRMSKRPCASTHPSHSTTCGSWATLISAWSGMRTRSPA